MKTQILETLVELAKVQSTRFASLTYRSKETNELARHTVLLGVSHEETYKRSLQKLLIIQPRLQDITLTDRKGNVLSLASKQAACSELIASLKNSLEKGIGNNDAYTCKGVYEQTSIKGVKLHEEKRELHLVGYSVSKKTIEKGIYKDVNSSEKTLAKQALRKLAKMDKIRQFALSLDTLQEVRANGKKIEFI